MSFLHWPFPLKFRVSAHVVRYLVRPCALTYKVVFFTVVLLSHTIKMVNTCSVAVCPSPQVKGISYHRFPRDPEIRRQWMLACRRADREVNPVTALICSNHFHADDFERDLQNELLGLPLKKKLKKGCVPSQNLGYAKILSTFGALNEEFDHINFFIRLQNAAREDLTWKALNGAFECSLQPNISRWQGEHSSGLHKGLIGGKTFLVT